MNLSQRLAEERVVAIVRGRDAEAAYRAVLTLWEEGIHLVEVSLTGADALRVIGRLADARTGAAALGAGTILSAQDARDVQSAGATFAVTPAIGPGTHTALELGLPTLVGALTPTEVYAAHSAGAAAVKLFPASHGGGPAYLKALRDPFPTVPFVPVGGVDVEAARRYLELGALAVGVGSPLLAGAADGADLVELRERARLFRQVAAEFPAPGAAGSAPASGEGTA
ncbi:bifunctional 4-hydroxy-2-oxoglutarate aldolase/2-dehydro-3-deoxy-phosphogluconate aldolase [Actinoalloteichus hymeniacidonis]|uniref:2-keto-3-deoxy-6-phosphogluconate aldolase n=1 Tax=Actinoalloteichus hymeniacidonis TaxID=340345 RepID=A0AAC9HQ78_9PSEU|nr:bifunctional 4-hydroxy-2-oxoglutarate aldolase/2-dehydro-3-deoxy-phosphogluconate aldolase [Actinoalloteichus hymeniacidonis]AOS63308.1 2-keto-3-deoxy-6-phosphogluconate aldolase [Actinoalloteichus hymeniacidonis]MBB5908653.1 2-dehydro-3-deoxyphosphogluconate aldolase/(4S)-4-hydroxy-2-oxoglutarate aldolase [Actinoalloteichus hymeniacidonis]